jgi:hypothetical protein
MVAIVPPQSESREVASYLTELEMRMKRVEAGLRTAQLGNSSLNNGGIPMFDADGNYRGTVGFQEDGTTTVTSKNPVPPPVPSGPQVTPAIGTLIVSHTGETATPNPNPADFSHLNVYTATPALPDTLTFRGTINPVPGEFPIPGLEYTTYLVYVTAVNMGGTESSPSIPTSGTPFQVDAPDIAAGAIVAGKIDAGAVTAITLEADLALVTRIIAGSPTGARVEIHYSAGIQAFLADGVTRTFWIDASTGSFTAVGTISTAFSGQRISLNPGGTSPDTIRFFPNTGNAYASIDSITSPNGAGILMYGATTGTLRGMVAAREDYASLLYCDSSLGNIRSDIFASSAGTRMRSYIVDLMTDKSGGSDPHIGFSCTSTGANIIAGTLLYFNDSGFTEPHFAAINKDSGITFAGGKIYIVGNNVTQRRDFQANNIIYDGTLTASGSNLKYNITPAQDLDVRQGVKYARGVRFQRTYLDEGPVYDADGNEIRGPVSAPVQLGLLADDLPPQVQATIKDFTPGGGDEVEAIDNQALLTLAWQGIGELWDKFDSHWQNPLPIPEASSGGVPLPASGCSLYCDSGSLYALFPSGKRVKIG